MGADLCGFICSGPNVLDKSKVKKAKEYVEKLVELAKKKSIQELVNKIDMESLETLGVNEDELPQFILINVLAIFKDFVDMWKERSYRDMMCRLNPCDEKMLILVAGELSWGDGPQEGTAWWICHAAYALGINEVLNIK